MKKLKMNMRYLMQLRQSPSMAVLLAEASPCPFGHKTRRSSAHKTRGVLQTPSEKQQLCALNLIKTNDLILYDFLGLKKKKKKQEKKKEMHGNRRCVHEKMKSISRLNEPPTAPGSAGTEMLSEFS